MTGRQGPDKVYRVAMLYQHMTPSSILAIVLANDAAAPLLFKGDDFAQTDVMTAPY